MESIWWPIHVMNNVNNAAQPISEREKNNTASGARAFSPGTGHHSYDQSQRLYNVGMSCLTV